MKKYSSIHIRVKIMHCQRQLQLMFENATCPAFTANAESFCRDVFRTIHRGRAPRRGEECCMP
jgi:hypothetical protein